MKKIDFMSSGVLLTRAQLKVIIGGNSYGNCDESLCSGDCQNGNWKCGDGSDSGFKKCVDALKACNCGIRCD